jgi:hypothetical protein
MHIKLGRRRQRCVELARLYHTIHITTLLDVDPNNGPQDVFGNFLCSEGMGSGSVGLTYALTTRLRSSGATLTRLGLTGNLAR